MLSLTFLLRLFFSGAELQTVSRSIKRLRPAFERRRSLPADSCLMETLNEHISPIRLEVFVEMIIWFCAQTDLVLTAGHILQIPPDPGLKHPFDDP